MNRTKSTILVILFILILLALSVALFAGTIKFNNTSKTDTPEEDQPSAEDQSANNAERIREIDEILNDKYMILVNADHGLDETYTPDETETLQDYTLEKVTAEHLKQMLDAASDEGYDNITIYSAFRNYAKQKANFNNKVEQYIDKGYSESEAEEKAATIVNPPGKSEHQTGMATDICTPEMINKYGSLPEEFEETDEYRWLYEHCAEFGFILRYPKDKEDITGISFEPWHYRYVGTECAKEIMAQKISLEEYIDTLKIEKDTLNAAKTDAVKS